MFWRRVLPLKYFLSKTIILVIVSTLHGVESTYHIIRQIQKRKHYIYFCKCLILQTAMKISKQSNLSQNFSWTTWQKYFDHFEIKFYCTIFRHERKSFKRNHLCRKVHAWKVWSSHACQWRDMSWASRDFLLLSIVR